MKRRLKYVWLVRRSIQRRKSFNVSIPLIYSLIIVLHSGLCLGPLEHQVWNINCNHGRNCHSTTNEQEKVATNRFHAYCHQLQFEHYRRNSKTHRTQVCQVPDGVRKHKKTSVNLQENGNLVIRFEKSWIVPWKVRMVNWTYLTGCIR